MNNIRDMLEDGILLLNSIASSTSQDGEINSHSEIIAIVQRSIEILLKSLASQASLQVSFEIVLRTSLQFIVNSTFKEAI